MQTQETVDIYDKNRQKLGYTKAKNSVLEEHEFIVIAHIIIFNSRGEMLIQRRAANKIDWPGCWDLSCGGGAVAGETSQECAKREAREELGLEISLESERPYLTVHYPKGFDDYYIVRMDMDTSNMDIQQDELTEIAWAGRAEVLSMMSTGGFVQYNDGFIEMLFALKDNRGSYKRRK